MPDPTGKKVFDLGAHISSTFKANSTGGRSQASLSGGGTAWECLIVWYMNLVFWNTNILVTRPNKNSLPAIISDAISVTIGGHRTNTESDVIVFSVPEPQSFVLPDKKKQYVEALNKHLETRLASSALAVVQCKTNWNDNAQIPMLWDLLYNSKGSYITSLSIGTGGVSPHSFERFTYSFVSVPTTTRSDYNETNLAVLRVRNLTGGNFWGKETKEGVALCINEFFGKNFTSAFKGGVAVHLQKQIESDPNYLASFLNLDWN